MYGLLKRRWLVITLAQLGVIMTQFLIFYVSLRGVEGWGEAGHVGARRRSAPSRPRRSC